jgi:diguanylate cyclase (GGDEF)-like protein/putative nucleotidyltransferase with HDIG domain
LAESLGVEGGTPKGLSKRIVDTAEGQLQKRMVNAGIWLTFAVCAAGLAYVAATWEKHNRGLIAILFSAGFLGGVLIALLPIERILRRPRVADVFFMTWSLFDIGLIAVSVAADGGARSPFTLLFFLPMVFAAVFYPLRTFMPVGAADVFAFLLVGDLYGDPDVAYVAFVAACLAAAAVLCAWQAQNHDRARDRLMLVSRTDPLTESLNRRGFEERLQATLDEGKRTGRPFALVMLDLDNFKAVNDVHGHPAGDELLCWVVEGVRRTVRTMDTIGRLGGDEFAVLAPGLEREGAIRLGERIRRQVRDRIMVTTGIACFPADGHDPDELQRYADAHLYEQKHGLAASFAAGRRELSWAATLARAVDVRMDVPSEHSATVARYAAGIAQRLGWGGADLAYLRVAAMLHDVGKVALPDQILRKPGPLDDVEYEEVKTHPVIGADFVNRVDGLSPIAVWVKHSHEHYDGTGYPDGLIGETIPLASRILLVADAFDAMTTDRPYRGAMTTDEAVAELRRNGGRQFDPRCVAAFEEFLGATEERAAEQVA